MTKSKMKVGAMIRRLRSASRPPKGEAHRYRFRVVALDTVLKLPEGTPYNQINEAIDGHIIGEGMLTGHFGH